MHAVFAIGWNDVQWNEAGPNTLINLEHRRKRGDMIDIYNISMSKEYTDLRIPNVH